ncbi:MAG: hypothetical protein GWP14_10405, partial [Actinobacteria bacterium]|nr:hypothetical protein [Actinomycetota bacterium]
MKPITHIHRNTSVFLAVAVASIMAWATEGLQGQVQAGRGSGLDANRLVGSGGRNPSGGGYSTLGNQIISGNVGAGKSFKGVGGVGDFRSFQGSLGTRALSSFSRDSYGLSGNAGRLGVAQPFYLPSGTVLGVRGITSGRSQPGSNMPRGVNLSPPPRRGPAVSNQPTGAASRFAAMAPADLRTDLRTSAQGQLPPPPIVETASNLFGIQRLSPESG